MMGTGRAGFAVIAMARKCSMLDVTIDRLMLRFEDGAGHEHRVRAITERAVALLGERLVDFGIRAQQDESVGEMKIPAVNLQLGRMSDEEAASAIAAGVLN